MSDIEVPSWAEFLAVTAEQLESGYVNGQGRLVLKQRDGTETDAGLVKANNQDQGSIQAMNTNLSIPTHPGNNSYLWGAATGWAANQVAWQYPVNTTAQFEMVNSGILIKKAGIYRCHLRVRPPANGYAAAYYGIRLKNGVGYYDWTPSIVPWTGTATGVSNVAQISTTIRAGGTETIGFDVLQSYATATTPANWGGYIEIQKIADLGV